MTNNHRIVRYESPTTAIIVCGSYGSASDQFDHPQGLFVDHLHNIYVADEGNDRIVRWSEGSKEGIIVVGGNGEGEQANQFNIVRSLSFDRQGNLYVADRNNHRIQKFLLDSN